MSYRSSRRLGFSLHHLEKIRELHDLCAAILPDSKQIAVTGHDVRGTRFYRTLQDSVIRRVLLDNIKSLSRRDQTGKAAEPCLNFIQARL